MIVGDLNSGEVLKFDADGSSETLVPSTAGITPLAILALGNGNLLIADSDLGQDPSGHHQIVQYDAATGATSQFIDLTAPLGTGTFSGDPPQPSSLALDADGNLLVGLSPDDGDDGAVEKFAIQTGAWIGTIATGVGDPSGLALVPSQVSDLLVGDLSGGILRYSAAQPLTEGSVASGDNGDYETSGVAVAPDGSFYVSSPGSGPGGPAKCCTTQVPASSSTCWARNDANPATLYYPGTLAFGPNGNLYVADLVLGVIDQFDVNSSTQQYLPEGTLQLPQGFTPAGFTFAADATRDPIVGDFNTGEVLQFNPDGSSKTLVPGSTTAPPSVPWRSWPSATATC